MEEKISKELFWNKAAVAGLALGGISVAYTFIGGIIQNLFSAGILSNLLVFILWLAKFIGCIWLMRFFMLRYISLEPAAARKDVFAFGTLSAFLSALIYSAFLLISFSVIDTEMFMEMMQPALDMLGEDQEDLVNQVISRLPTITFFSYLIYCTLYGTILSSILSPSLMPNDPFRNSGFGNQTEKDDQTDNQ